MGMKLKLLVFFLTTVVFKNAALAQKLDFFYQSKQGQFPNQRIFGADIKKNNNAVILYSTGELSTELIGENYSKTIDKQVAVLLELTPNGDMVRETQIELKRESENIIEALSMGLDENANTYITFYLYGELEVYVNGVLQTTMNPVGELTSIKGFGVIKLDKDGNFIDDWIIDLNEPLYGFFDIDVGPAGVYVMYSTVKNTTTSADGATIFNLNQHLKRFSQNGVLIDELSFTGLLSNRTSNTDDRFVLANLAVNSSGEVFLTGRIANNAQSTLSTDFPLSTSTTAARSGVVLIKLSADLNYEWKRTFTGGAFNYISSPSISPDDGVVLSYSIQDDVSRSSPKIRLHELNLEIPVRDRLDELTTASFNSILKLSKTGELMWSTVSKGARTGEIFQNLNGEVYVLNGFDYNFQGSDSQGNYFLRKNPKGIVENARSFLIKLTEEGVLLNTSFFTKKVKDSGQYLEIEYSYILPFNGVCEEFYLAASFNGKFDINPDINSETLIESTSTRDLFFAKFGDSTPIIDIEDLQDTVCSFSMVSKNFTLIDENPQEITFSVTSNAPNVIPSDSVKFRVLGNRVNMEIGVGELSGIVILNIKATDNCGYQDSFEFTLNIESGLIKPIINSGQLLYVLCEGETIELGTGEDGNLWSNGSENTSIVVDRPGQYWVKRISENGCESINSDTVTVEFVPRPIQPIVTASGPLTFCEGEQVTLTSDIKENILWSSGETSQTITVSQSGLYSVWQQSEVCGNSVPSKDIEVVVNPIPEQPLINVTGDTQFCEGGFVVLSTNETGNIQWSNGATESSIEVKKSGEYTLYVERNGCTSQISEPINIKVDEDFTFTMVSDTVVCEGFEQLEIMPELEGGNADYLWSDGSSLPSLIIDTAGSYWLEISNGTCEKPRVYIEVSEACYPKILIPTAFSPNGDGTNDTFEIMGSRIHAFELRIFNRWGN